jgi:maltoporin
VSTPGKGGGLAVGASLLAALSTSAALADTEMVTGTAPDTAAGARISAALDDEFRSDTETRDQSAGRTFLEERAEQVLENFIELGGYFRAGYARSGKGGPMQAFAAPGAASKYRLGNEAENYGELILGKNFYLPGVFNLDAGSAAGATFKGPVARVQVRLSFYNPYSASAAATSVGLPEAWASIGNVLPFAPSTKLWAGNRFYRRHDIHMLDFYYWNMSGGGGGIEDIPLGPGHLAFAWIGWGSTSGLSYVPEPDPENAAGFNKATYDLRAYDLPLLFGQLEVGVSFVNATSGVDELGRQGPTGRGFGATLIHTLPHFISDDGIQKLSIQFGTGPARTFTAGFETQTLPEGTFIHPDEDVDYRFRVTESFSANVGRYFSIGPVLVFQQSHDDSLDMDQTWLSAGVRPIFHFTRHVNLALEGGVDWVNEEELASAGLLGKLTIAPQISIADRWNSRPVIRGFVTGAFWSDDFVGRVGGADYATSKHGVSAGMQMEAWW